MNTVPELDDYIDSLVDNGMNIQVQLMYGNVMYTSPSGKLPDVSSPEPGSFHNDDRSLIRFSGHRLLRTRPRLSIAT